ncbi:hypothetical protein [Streptomyces sp. Wb2n-11]|uniref:hypothetical protein n=1 Tax=Streptomyces sp. Wb2n-11 TaxID=1030533 RepID=UPI0021004115|nr:hypothetical protein [Streptomyces sp. Wb2n-11]
MFHHPTVPLAPMTPDVVLSAFRCLRAMEAGDTEAAAGFADADPRLPALLPNVAQRIIVPVTAIRAMCGIDPEPVDDSFALEALGRVFVDALRTWAQGGPNSVEGVAHAVIAFVRQLLTVEDCGETVAEVLRQLEAVGFGQALAARPTPAGAPAERTTAV